MATQKRLTRYQGTHGKTFQSVLYTLPPTNTDNYVLTGGVAKTITVPSNAVLALFSFNDNIWVNFDTDATVPSSDNTDGDGSVLNPSRRTLSGISTFSIISDANCAGSIEWYSE